MFVMMLVAIVLPVVGSTARTTMCKTEYLILIISNYITGWHICYSVLLLSF
jgi:hypothetical protein